MKTLLKATLLLIVAGLCALPANAVGVSINGKAVRVNDYGDYSYVVTHAKAPLKVSVDDFGKDLTLDVSPHSRGVKCKVANGKAGFKIKRQGHYIVTFSDRKKLFIFAEDAPATPQGLNVLQASGMVADGKTNVTKALQSLIDANAGKTLIFPQGTYLLSGLTLHSDTHLFLTEGATLKADPDDIIYPDDGTHAFVEILDADNVSIRGNGVIDGNGQAIQKKGLPRRNILSVNSTNLTLEDFFSINPARWNTHILGCGKVDIKRVKLVNDWNLRNTDGFDPDCSSDVLIENCFGHCGDDCVAIKTTTRMGGKARNLRNVTVRGCVFETKKSALKVGTETCADEMCGILFEDNDVVESDRGMSMYVNDGTELHDVVYRNNRFERNYPDLQQRAYQFAVSKRHKDSKLGAIHDVLIENCRFEQAFPNESKIDNRFSARLEVEFKGLILPEGKPVARPGSPKSIHQ